ncbi:MAG TPA: DUF4240 domain-containing protein [Longimicrobiales bacterium]|nr:DUF4240 domain-containing protein [Longimicrobiales bacterium]
MTADFWALVAETRPDDGDPARHAEALTAKLVAQGAESVRAYGVAFDQAMDTLYDWDLWGAAYLALGGCGDDAFEYFRAWIVGRGEAAWRQAGEDPQAFLLSLIGDAEDPEDRLFELGVHDGEPLLYAGGTAHERLTGAWLPPREAGGPEEPSGEPWEEEDLGDRFPALAARMPDDLPGDVDLDGLAEEREIDGLPAATPPDPTQEAVDAGLDAYSAGNHAEAELHLGPLVDDSGRWPAVHPGLQVDVAYVVSAIRLQDGKVDAAAEALALILDRMDEVPPVRRALAQIELARGRLDEAARWIDDRPEAARMDRALAAKLAWRRGHRDDALTRTRTELTAGAAGYEHPWDVAGALYQVGTVLAETGDAEGAEMAVRTMATFLGGAPEDLPLFTHMKLLVAAVTRLQERYADAVEQLEPLCETTIGTDRAEAFRERARSLRGLGREDEAGADYEEAIRGFETAGERWDLAATRREMEAG